MLKLAMSTAVSASGGNDHSSKKAVLTLAVPPPVSVLIFLGVSGRRGYQLLALNF